jgi:hypothetical protein
VESESGIWNLESKIMILTEITNGNLLLGLVPESLALLMFGVSLIVFTVSVRRVTDRKNDSKQLENSLEKLAKK